MKPGTQIAYLPRHAQGNIRHRDVEFGFVLKPHPSGRAYWCRFWRRGSPGELRTLNNSELALADDLVEHAVVAQAVVDQALAWIEAQ